MLKDTIPMLFPADFDASLHFYVNVLGFVEADKGEDFVELKSGTLTLWLHSDSKIDDTDYKSEIHEHKRGVGVVLNFEVDDVDKYYERIVQKGGAPTEQEPASTPWGTRKFTVRDPDGYHVSVFSYQ